MKGSEMRETVLLARMFEVRPRFSRSVNVALDYSSRDALDGYILTPLTLSIMRRVADALRPGARGRSWSITGPYGTGKSACTLFLACTFASATRSQTQQARSELRSADPDLSKRVFARGGSLFRSNGLMPVPVTGSRRPITDAVLEGLEAALRRELGKSKRAIPVIKRIVSLRNRGLRGKPVTVEDVASLLNDVAAFVIRRKYAGLLIVIDELGKLLEHAALHPERDDVFVLQTLSEAASRSAEAPILLVTVLHQDFARYAEPLGVEHQQEWAKVQGRFEDIGFLESTDQLLRIIGAAIGRKAELHDYARAIREEVSTGVSLNVLSRGYSREEIRRNLECCAPLHPVTAVLLGPLFRQLAQNERSLFAFLTSGEPFSLRSFLSDESNSWRNNGMRPFYRVDQLYDYAVTALGSALAANRDGKRWAEINDALNRLPKDAAGLDARMIKAIGMLSMLGDGRHLKASEKILQFALADGSTVSREDISASLARLSQKQIVTYRHHSESYAIWEGSDIDLDVRFREARTRFSGAAELLPLLTEHIRLLPYVAKRYLHQQGTLRYFLPVLTNRSKVREALDGCTPDADGLVLFVLPEKGETVSRLEAELLETSRKLPKPLASRVLFGIPERIGRLRSAVEELVTWETVRKTTPELEGDRVARAELAVRLSGARDRLEQLCEECFGKEHCFAACRWVFDGESMAFNAARNFASRLSDIFDKVFHSPPVIHNELVNRRRLSPAATAARKELMEQMLAHPDVKGLEISGTPPAMSMYISVLERTGIHRELSGRYIFGPPQDDALRITPTWEAMDEFLATTESGRRSVADLFGTLSSPPFGIRGGLLPILFLARIIHGRHEIAIYENEAFVPEYNAATLERLAKAPSRFSVQEYRILGARENVFRRLVDIAAPGQPHDKATLLTALRPLYAFIGRLPEYSQGTRRISTSAAEVRSAILTAQDPQRLLFEDIPRAVGMERIPDHVNDSQVDEFFGRLKAALTELQRAYDSLLDEIKGLLQGCLGLPGELAAMRQMAAGRSACLAAMVSDLRLKSFILRLSDTALEHRAWLESVASCVVAKPPGKWLDTDLIAFDAALTELSAQFRRVEEIAAEKGEAYIPADARLFRAAVTEGNGKEYSHVVYVDPGQEKHAQTIAGELEALVGRATEDGTVRAAAAMELFRRLLDRSESHKELP